MDEKLKSVLERVIRLCGQNTEFDRELRKAFEMVPSANSASLDEERISQIYEYCIEKVLKKQAKEFYTDFPLTAIVPTLIEDYVRMESFRRKDQFGDFCLALYQQIENIANKLGESASLQTISERMWGCPAYIKSEKEAGIGDRLEKSTFTVATLVFPGQNKKTGQPYSIEKSQQALQTLYAIDKVKAIVYYVGYKAAMRSCDYDNYIEITNSINEVYQCRNMNHRGNTQTQWEKDTLDRILPMKSYYYFKFLGVLAQFVNSIKQGYACIPDIEKYAKSVAAKVAATPETGPKIVATIDVSGFPRKFK